MSNYSDIFNSSIFSDDSQPCKRTMPSSLSIDTFSPGKKRRKQKDDLNLSLLISESKDEIFLEEFYQNYLRRFILKMPAGLTNFHAARRYSYQCHKCKDYFPNSEKFIEQHFEQCDYVSFYLKSALYTTPESLPTVKDNICGLCGDKFRERSELNEHIFKTHKPTKQTDITLISKFPVHKKCMYCPSRLHQPENVLYHNYYVHKIIPHCENELVIEESKIKVLKCFLCEGSFQLADLVKHYSRVHDMVTGLTDILCQICGHVSESISDLSMHLIEAHRIKEMSRLEHFLHRINKCNLCFEREFYSFSTGIHRHYREFHDERRAFDACIFSCPICELIFDSRETIIAHLKDEHSVLKAFPCFICHRDDFTSRLAIVNHIKREHYQEFNKNSIFRCEADGMNIKRYLL